MAAARAQGADEGVRPGRGEGRVDVLDSARILRRLQCCGAERCRMVWSGDSVPLEEWPQQRSATREGLQPLASEDPSFCSRRIFHQTAAEP